MDAVNWTETDQTKMDVEKLESKKKLSGKKIKRKKGSVNWMRKWVRNGSHNHGRCSKIFTSREL